MPSDTIKVKTNASLTKFNIFKCLALSDHCLINALCRHFWVILLSDNQSACIMIAEWLLVAQEGAERCWVGLSSFFAAVLSLGPKSVYLWIDDTGAPSAVWFYSMMINQLI